MTYTTYDDIELDQKRALFISKHWDSAIFKNQFTLKRSQEAWNERQMKLALKKAITTMNEIKNKEITDSFTKEVQKSRLKESLSEARTIKAKLEEIEISKGNWNNLIRAHAVSQEKQAQLILDFFL